MVLRRRGLARVSSSTWPLPLEAVVYSCVDQPPGMEYPLAVFDDEDCTTMVIVSTQHEAASATAPVRFGTREESHSPEWNPRTRIRFARSTPRHWGDAYEITEALGVWRAVRRDNQVACERTD